MLFFAAAYFVVGNVEMKNKYAYAEHIFQENVVNEIDIQIDEADWQDMLENPLEEEYHQANVTINGETNGNVAIRTKGNNTLTSVANSDSDRYSLKIDFDYYDDNGNYYGLKKLCLNNNFGDSSSMREYISYKIMGEMGIPVPGCGYSHITINGEEWGLYLAVEAIDEVFLATHFEDGAGDLYKPDGTGADLVYRGDDISEYSGLNLKTNEGTADSSKIIALMKALESGKNLEQVLDIESTLKYIAANVALASYDSYLGGTTHNYYLYEQDGVFSILPWDFNYAFGAFGGGEVDIYEPANNSMGGRGGNREEKPTENVGEPTAENEMEMPAQNRSEMFTGKEMERSEMGEMSKGSNMSQMPEGAKGNGFGGMGGSTSKPLVDTLLADEALLTIYEGYLKELADRFLTQEYMTAIVTQTHDLISPYVEQDATAFYTYEEFEQACSVDPTDAYSLVYYAVNMAESIRNQLSGGEPTFDTSSLQGGGMHMGGKEGMLAFGGELPEMGNAPAAGEENAAEEEQQIDLEMQTDPEMQEQQKAQTREERSTFGNEKGGKGGRPEGMGGMPGERGQQPVDVKEILPEIAVCIGVFAVGFVFAMAFKRKKDLK